jgi:hypothetical protein
MSGDRAATLEATMDDDAITIGAQVLSPTGRTWTIRSITPSGSRVVLPAARPDGHPAAIMDRVAVLRMARVDQRLAVGTDLGLGASAEDLTAA